MSGCAATPVGAEGATGPSGVTVFEGAERAPSPLGLTARTLNVYWVPASSPPMVVCVAGGEPVTVFVVCAWEPTYGVTWYVATEPPLVGAVQDTSADLRPAAAVTPV